ncbi:MAG: hypothetical protein ACLR8J_03020 [Sutterella wadsworthensis]
MLLSRFPAFDSPDEMSGFGSVPCIKNLSNGVAHIVGWSGKLDALAMEKEMVNGGKANKDAGNAETRFSYLSSSATLKGRG